MRSEGLNEASIQEALQSLVTDIINEIEIMRGFRGNSNIVSYEDHKVVEQPDGIGWNIMIRMELLQSLSNHAAGKPLPTEEVIKLGIHMCKALELCAKKNIIHRDIKPDNIFVSEHDEYKLGDFGIARQIERTMSGLSKKGTYSYMAPEVYKGDRYGPGVDIYSLGVVMYTLLNKNRGPFLPDYPMKIMPGDRDRALEKRMGGEPFPVLKEVSPELNALLQKACAYDRDQRFADPAEMGEALLFIQTTQKKGKHSMAQALDVSLGQAMYTTLGQEKGGGILMPGSGQASGITEIPEFMTPPAEQDTEEPADQSVAAPTENRPTNKKKRLLIVGLALSAVVLLLATVWAVYYTQRDQPNPPNSPWLAVKMLLEELGDNEASEHSTGENGDDQEADNSIATTGGIGAETGTINNIDENVSKAGAAQYTVSYDYAENGGAAATKTMDITTSGAAVDLTPQATKSGWQFVGWNTDKNAVTPLSSHTMPNSNATLYAIYSKTLTATFNDYGGTSPITRTASIKIYNKTTDGKITVPVQNTYTGWQSRGWSTATAPKADVMVTSGSYTINSNMTFYGLYQRTFTLNYTITGNTAYMPDNPLPASQTGIQYANSNSINTYDNPRLTVVSWTDKKFSGYWNSGNMNYRAGDVIILTSDKTLAFRYFE
jgi:uncharacterized repeat protein (TIGR02543 family)